LLSGKQARGGVQRKGGEQASACELVFGKHFA
jgi:hypothetical protein